MSSEIDVCEKFLVSQIRQMKLKLPRFVTQLTWQQSTTNNNSTRILIHFVSASERNESIRRYDLCANSKVFNKLLKSEQKCRLKKIYIFHSAKEMWNVWQLSIEKLPNKRRKKMGGEKAKAARKSLSITPFDAQNEHISNQYRETPFQLQAFCHLFYGFFLPHSPVFPLFHFEKIKYHFVWAQHTNGKFGDKTLFSAVWFVLNIQHKNRIVTVRVIEPRYCLCAALSASSYVQFRSILFVIRKEKRMKSLDTGSLMFYRILCVEFVPHFYWLFHFEKALFVINVYILAFSSFRQPFSMTTIVGFYLQI